MAGVADDQMVRAERLLFELECCGDVGEVDALTILDSLAVAGLALVESLDMEASQAFIEALTKPEPEEE